jgi:hypothetical protein
MCSSFSASKTNLSETSPDALPAAVRQCTATDRRYSDGPSTQRLLKLYKAKISRRPNLWLLGARSFLSGIPDVRQECPFWRRTWTNVVSVNLTALGTLKRTRFMSVVGWRYSTQPSLSAALRTARAFAHLSAPNLPIDHRVFPESRSTGEHYFGERYLICDKLVATHLWWCVRRSA